MPDAPRTLFKAIETVARAMMSATFARTFDRRLVLIVDGRSFCNTPYRLQKLIGSAHLKQ